MSRFARVAQIGVTLALVGGLVRATGPDVRVLMTPEEFQAAGLDKLSPQELEALNRWVVRYTAGDAPEAAGLM